MYPRSWGVNGSVQITSTLRKIRPNRDFYTVIGHLEDQGVKEEIASWCKAAAVVKDLQNAKAAYLPTHCEGMYDTWVDDSLLSKLFGIVPKHISVNEVIQHMRTIQENDIKLRYQEVTSKFELIEPCEQELRSDLHVGLAVEKVIAQHELNIIAVQPWPEFVQHTGTFGLIGFSLIADQGIAVADEGDICTGIAQYILQQITGKPTQFFENLAFDLDDNLLLGGHDGLCPPSLGQINYRKIRNNMYGEMSSFTKTSGGGLAFEFITKPGIVTILGLGIRSDGLFFKVMKGCSVSDLEQVREIHMPHSIIRFENHSVKHYFDRLTEWGGGHHFALVHADVVSEIRKIGKILRIPVEEIN
jgi:L-arabinose isomerase